MCPARTSASVVTCTAWQSIHPPGASFDVGQAIGPGILLSASMMSCSVTSPVLVTR